jgi:hypothetical protein
MNSSRQRHAAHIPLAVLQNSKPSQIIEQICRVERPPVAAQGKRNRGKNRTKDLPPNVGGHYRDCSQEK